MGCFVPGSSASSKLAVWLWVLSLSSCQAFAPLHKNNGATATAQRGVVRPTNFQQQQNAPSLISLRMALDPVTYLRTEWISASLVANQTPRSADVCLQLGTQDGRVVSYVPRTVREFLTSSAEADGKLTVRVQRQLQESETRRKAAKVIYLDQRADDLSLTKDDSVDVVMSLQAIETMKENGLDWRKSVREAARVLKPGGRFIWVEPTEIDGKDFVDYISSLVDMTGQGEGGIEASEDDEDDDDESGPQPFPVFDDGGFDAVDFVLQPHTAGVAFKSLGAGLTPEQRAKQDKMEEQEKMADRSIQAYERGIKKKRKKKKKKKGEPATEETA
mmetsp:Transcript_14855/g.19435  ORF Transcript_14855/g.19435 Transcript_14855/m.19435 type:complete len:331 (-) Transcript_14855:167-1159(-)|eukprot:CAMPEP_0198140376 /NCGR_PEP_ID=MMETSP1443-20131203/3538_1 /TAXON_ID=186043 /ORGANISM="Entomoneis sp., Strain CCMP2396" /LENGTH=330 /DNA_ID=CAMNT_0043802769 /DNA_START=60 /DNA_END=1052 /DNA_ORIENTATION=-